jgi:hypothetical protein
VIGPDKEGLPASIAGLFGMAFALYARRFAMYASLAIIALGVQYIVDTQLTPDDYGMLIGLDIVVDSFIAAAVSIGVAFDLAGKEADWSRIITAASLRWGVVGLISLIAFFVSQLFIPYMVLPSEQTGYGLLLLPFVILWGAVIIATVPAAIDPATSRLLLPLLALGKGMAVSTRIVNLGRLMLFSVLLTLPVVAEILLGSSLHMHNVALIGFWASIPIDTICLGPLQAIATVLYVDFLRRAGR